MIVTLSPVEDQAIAARMALIVGATTFDRLFAGVRFDEVDRDMLYVYAKDEETAAYIGGQLCSSYLNRRDWHSKSGSQHRAGFAKATDPIGSPVEPGLM